MNHWRRLPIPLPPAQQETLASYLHRLAVVHGLHDGDLRQHLGMDQRAKDPQRVVGLARRLAAVTGHPAPRLAWALPEVRSPAPDWRHLRHLAQRACPRCTVRYQGGPVRRLFAHNEYLCVRHGYWIGPPDPIHDDPPQYLAARVPSLVAAQHRLRRTMRRHGWAATFDATAAATSICIHLRFSARHHPLWTRWEQRIDMVMPAAYRRSLFVAAIYPEASALAAVLAAPGWRALARSSRTTDVDRLLGAAAHALGCTDALSWHEISDALMAWASTHAAGRVMEPAGTYPDTSHHDDGTPRVTDSQRLAEQRTVHRFARDRRAPRTYDPAAAMPYAHRPTEATVPTGRTS